VRARALAIFAILAPLASGCFAPLKNLQDESAIEQEMTSAAIARSVAALPVEAIDRRKAYLLRIAAPTGVDTALIRARLQQRLSEQQIRTQPESATRGPTLLAVVPFAGADVESTLIGIPFAVPGVPAGLGDISSRSSPSSDRSGSRTSTKGRCRVTSLDSHAALSSAGPPGFGCSVQRREW
jgi:hypothetical protein